MLRTVVSSPPDSPSATSGNIQKQACHPLLKNPKGSPPTAFKGDPKGFPLAVAPPALSHVTPVTGPLQEPASLTTRPPLSFLFLSAQQKNTHTSLSLLQSLPGHIVSCSTSCTSLALVPSLGLADALRAGTWSHSKPSPGQAALPNFK